MSDSGANCTPNQKHTQRTRDRVMRMSRASLLDDLEFLDFEWNIRNNRFLGVTWASYVYERSAIMLELNRRKVL